MSKINMGTLYDANKELVLKEEKITNEELAKNLVEIKNFCIKSKNRYFMLLNRERYDFTLFDFGESLDKWHTKGIIYDDLRDCLKNRGKIVSMHLTEAEDAYEIWIIIENQAFVYYFFPYDQGVIN